MNRKGSVGVLLVIVIVVALAIGALWYYGSQSTTTQQQTAERSLSFSCPQNGSAPLQAYEDQTSGFAFCYPLYLTISTGTNDLNTGTHIDWPNQYRDPVMGYTVNPSLSFVVTKSTSSSIAASLPQCDLSGSKGDYWCDPPTQSQITQGTSTGGLQSALFRTDFELNHSVIGTSSGPYAYVEIGSGTYLVFQAPSAAILPSYVDKDLKEILNTVVAVPR
jgi:hypothetical protein